MSIYHDQKLRKCINIMKKYSFGVFPLFVIKFLFIRFWSEFQINIYNIVMKKVFMGTQYFLFYSLSIESQSGISHLICSFALISHLWVMTWLLKSGFYRANETEFTSDFKGIMMIHINLATRTTVTCTTFIYIHTILQDFLKRKSNKRFYVLVYSSSFT